MFATEDINIGIDEINLRCWRLLLENRNDASKIALLWSRSRTSTWQRAASRPKTLSALYAATKLMEKGDTAVDCTRGIDAQCSYSQLFPT